MTIRVDADQWRRFDLAAARASRAPEEIILEFMRDYAARNPSGSASGGTGFDFIDGRGATETLDLFGGAVVETDSQIDLEDFLGRRR